MHLERPNFMKYMKKKIRDKSMVVQNACMRLRWNSHSNKLHFRGAEGDSMMFHLTSVLNTFILTTSSLQSYWSY